MLAPADFGVALLIACVGAAIVVGVSFSIANYTQKAAEVRLGDMAGDLARRMRLVFEPSVSVLRAAAAACSDNGINFTSWDRIGTAMFDVRCMPRCCWCWFFGLCSCWWLRW